MLCAGRAPSCAPSEARTRVLCPGRARFSCFLSLSKSMGARHSKSKMDRAPAAAIGAGHSGAVPGMYALGTHLLLALLAENSSNSTGSSPAGEAPLQVKRGSGEGGALRMSSWSTSPRQNLACEPRLSSSNLRPLPVPLAPPTTKCACRAPSSPPSASTRRWRWR